MLNCILAVITAAAVLVADQLTKAYIVANFTHNFSKSFIPYLIDLTFIYNGGGAWGMLSGHTWILLTITAIIMLACIIMLIKLGTKNKLLFWAVCLVLGGGIGNMIDRIFRDGLVVDFLQFAFWKSFPVFNVADIAIVIGAGLLILYFVISSADEMKDSRKIKSSMPSEENDAENL